MFAKYQRDELQKAAREEGSHVVRGKGTASSARIACACGVVCVRVVCVRCRVREGLCTSGGR